LIELEGHGRTQLEDVLDLSRTVGWFTAVFPVRIDLGPDADWGEQLKSVKEYLRRIPNSGVGYGVLRYLNPDPEVGARLCLQPQPEISFNYLGQFDQVLTGKSAFRVVGEPAGDPIAPNSRRNKLLEIGGSVTGDRLHLSFTYSKSAHSEATMQQVADDVMAALRGLMTHCLEKKDRVYTASDFPLAGLSAKNLDQVIRKLGGKGSQGNGSTTL
jgi:non-ribosomal peptide synthase protein (TIGR01720 family)